MLAHERPGDAGITVGIAAVEFVAVVQENGVLVGGLVLLYVVVLAWVRAPRSGVRRDTLSQDDSFSELR